MEEQSEGSERARQAEREGRRGSGREKDGEKERDDGVRIGEGSKEGAREGVAVSSVTCRRRLPFRHRPSEPSERQQPPTTPFNNNNNRAGPVAVGRRGGMWTGSRGCGRRSGVGAGG